jgi:hypothetical protein
MMTERNEREDQGTQIEQQHSRGTIKKTGDQGRGDNDSGRGRVEGERKVYNRKDIN